MAKVNQDQEPSMEEILASIRRIISDDEQSAASGAGEPAGDDMSAELSQDDLDALFDAPAAPEPAPAPEPEPEPDVIDEPEAELSQDDLDALFDAPAAPEPEPESQNDDVLDLTDDLAIDEGVDENFAPEMITEGSDLEFAEPEPVIEPEPEPETAAEEPTGIDEALNAASNDVDIGDVQQLLSPSADAAVSAAFGNLAHTILSNNARTLEDLVGEMLRPMLKSWLDDNLPALVERLVRQEIERVSRGR